MYLLGIDPGATTGLVVYNAVLNRIEVFEEVEVQQDKLGTVEDFIACIDFFMEEYLIEGVVIEETILTGQRAGPGKHDQVSADVIARYIVRANGVDESKTVVVKPEVANQPYLQTLDAVLSIPAAYPHARAAAKLVISQVDKFGPFESEEN